MGPCGEYIDCADYERAIVSVEAKYVHPDHISVDAAVAQMGNHLIDSKTPELGDPPTPFAQTYIFGSNEGRVIFQEVMLTRDRLASDEAACYPIKQPQAWRTAGWYPTEYCIRHDPAAGTRDVTVERFMLREGG